MFRHGSSTNTVACDDHAERGQEGLSPWAFLDPTNTTLEYPESIVQSRYSPKYISHTTSDRHTTIRT